MTCETLFATAETADRSNAEIGIIWWLKNVEGFALAIADYDLFDVETVNADWVDTFFRRSAEIAAKYRPKTRGCLLRVEHRGLVDLLKRADAAFCDTEASERINRYEFDIRPIRESESSKWAPTFDERVFAVRPLVESKKVVRPATGLRHFGRNGFFGNHLARQIKAHQPGTRASELMGAFVLGVLLGTTRAGMSFFEAMSRLQDPPDSSPSPFAAAGYFPGRRPL